ncbi:MAG TPA: hypothetical protein PLZ67_02465 [Bacteroidales bacterium]|nr:hypothetical protein [Bacteroidales bacterium]
METRKQLEEKMKYFNLNLEHCPIRDVDNTFSILRQDIDWSQKQLEDFPFDNIGEIEKNFNISRNNITSFKNGPKRIGGFPNFCFNIELNSLDFAPELNPEKYATNDAFNWLLKQMGIEPTGSSEMTEWAKINMERLTDNDDQWASVTLSSALKVPVLMTTCLRFIIMQISIRHGTINQLEQQSKIVLKC